MTVHCPVPLCETEHESMDHLVDHLGDDHDLFGKVARGELELRRPAVADGGERQ